MRTIALYAIVLSFAFCLSSLPAMAISPTPTVAVASPSATPTSTEDEKVKEIRDAIKEKVNEIKEKIEKKAYVGIISQITDSTLMITNFRGKQRVRILEETTIIGANKKEIKSKDLAVEDKIISLGTIAENEILEAKRIIVVPPPKSPPAKRIVLAGTIGAVDLKKSTITVASTELKLDKDSSLVSVTDTKASLKLKDLSTEKKVIVVYLEVATGKTPIVKTLFVLP